MTRRGNHRITHALIVGGSVAGVALTWYLMLAYRVEAHDALPTAAAPKGWSYPYACCSGYDCREVPADWIGEGAGGFRIVITGEVVGYQDKRLRDSPDGAYHWCSVQGKNDGKTICLFVPPRSF